jgi:hypothetical protein
MIKRQIGFRAARQPGGTSSNRALQIPRDEASCAQESDFSDIVRNTPCGGGSGWKEDNVSRPNSSFFSAFYPSNEGFPG